jgi:hypothetical protein
MQIRRLKMENKMLSERDAAKIIGVSYQTLGNYRRAKKGPKCIVVEGLSRNTIIYQYADIIKWKEQKQINHPGD